MLDILGAGVWSKYENRRRKMDKKEELLKRLQEIFEISDDTINEETVLPSDAWDSLELLAVSSAIDEIFDVIVPMKELKHCLTIKDILDAVAAEGNGCA